MNMNPLVAATLTAAQQESIDYFRALGRAAWFVGEAREDGSVEVIAIMSDFTSNTVWSLIVEADGDISTSQAECGPFETGIDV